MKPYIAVSSLLLTAVLAACSGTSAPDAIDDRNPAYASIDLQTDFQNDHVVVTLDGKQVLDGRASTNPASSVASRVAVAVVPGMHRLVTEVLDTGAKSDMMVSLRDTTTVRIIFDREVNQLAVSTVPFLIAYR